MVIFNSCVKLPEGIYFWMILLGSKFESPTGSTHCQQLCSQVQPDKWNCCWLHPTSSHGTNTFDQPAPTEIPMDGHSRRVSFAGVTRKAGNVEKDMLRNAAVARDEEPELATSENTGTPHWKGPGFYRDKIKEIRLCVDAARQCGSWHQPEVHWAKHPTASFHLTSPPLAS